MIKRTKKCIKKPPYCYSYKRVMYEYSFLKEKEIKQVLDVDYNKSLVIIRLDGKGLTRNANTNDTIDKQVHIALTYVVKNIAEFCKIEFAYSTDDEISLVLKKEYLENKKIEYRLEKVLTYLSGYVSSLFTIGFCKETQELKVFSFDARAIVIDKKEIKNYFLIRQRISIQHFIEKLCNRFGFERRGYTIEEIDQLLRMKGMEWGSYPRNIAYGIVGRYKENEEWVVEDAMEFQKETLSSFSG